MWKELPGSLYGEHENNLWAGSRRSEVFIEKLAFRDNGFSSTKNFHRFLRAGGKLDKSSDSDLGGFEWKHALDRVTRGVLIWPEVFKVNHESGDYSLEGFIFQYEYAYWISKYVCIAIADPIG